MSSRLSNSQQVFANQDLVTHLALLHDDAQLGDVSRQWRMTLYFYVAVHHVEEQFRLKHYSVSKNHKNRNFKIRNLWDASQRAAVKSYMDLYTQSKRTRYQGVVPSDAELTDAETALLDVMTNLV